MRNLQDLTDEELALFYVEGNNRAFDLLLSRNEVKLFTYIMFFVRDQEVANDIFQETFLKRGKQTSEPRIFCKRKIRRLVVAYCP